MEIAQCTNRLCNGRKQRKKLLPKHAKTFSQWIYPKQVVTLLQNYLLTSTKNCTMYKQAVQQ